MSNIGFGLSGIATETTVVDSEGQRLVLRIDNLLGGGGQRKVAIYCPFWIVNTTEHALRYRQEGKSSYVSGTVSEGKDGSSPVDGSDRNARVTEGRTAAHKTKLRPANKITSPSKTPPKAKGVKVGKNKSLTLGSPTAKASSTKAARQIYSRATPSGRALDDQHDSTIYSGKRGALYKAPGHFMTEREVNIMRNKDLPLEQTVALSFMFNFNDQNVLSLGQQKLCVMFGDTASGMSSDWSQGYSLDTVGVTQILGMHVRDGRNLEISLSISVAPGRLSQYTKIVRFSPRYVFVNKLPKAVSLWQDSSLLHNDFSSTNTGRWDNMGVDGKLDKFGGISQGEKRRKSPHDVLFGRDIRRGKDRAKKEISKNHVALFGDFATLNPRVGFGKSKDKKDGSRRNKLVEHLGGGGSGAARSSSRRPMARNTFAPNAASRTGNFIGELGENRVSPFFLPDTRADRLLRLDLGPRYYCTSSFPADTPGMYHLPVRIPRDPSQLAHVSTRSSAEYDIKLPPVESEGKAWEGELGVWFETDWDHKGVVVKGCKRNKFAFNHTDIRAGDILIQIDDRQVVSMSFDTCMETLKDRFKDIHADGNAKPLLLKFMTLEERMKKVRKKALNTQGGRAKGRKSDKRTSLEESFERGKDGFDQISTTGTEGKPGPHVPQNPYNSNDSNSSVTSNNRSDNSKEDDDDDDASVTSLDNDYGNNLDSPYTTKWAGSPVGQGNFDGVNNNPEDDDRKAAVTIHKKPAMSVTADVATIGNSLFLTVAEANTEEPPYRIVNSSSTSVISFKQRNTDGHPWVYLQPGEAISYMWEEPMKPRKLNVRVCELNVFGRLETSTHGKKNFWGVDGEYDSKGSYGTCKVVKLDEIGFTDLVPRVGVKDETKSNSLWCSIYASGATKVLKVSNRESAFDERAAYDDYVKKLTKEIRAVRDARDEIEKLREMLPAGARGSSETPSKAATALRGVLGPVQSGSEEMFGNVDAFDSRGLTMLERPSLSDFNSSGHTNESGWRSSLTGFMSNNSIGVDSIGKIDPEVDKKIQDELQAHQCAIDQGVCIEKCHQLLVEVVEGCGLKAHNLGGMSNPYAEVYLKNHFKKVMLRKVKHRTYYIEKSVHPKWTNQIFVIDIPQQAVQTTRGYSVRVRLKDFEFLGTGNFLGQCDVQLNSLAGQQETVGWFPLTARTGKVFQRSSNEKVSGSVKLRLQWIHSTPSLLKYRHNFLTTRLETLETKRKNAQKTAEELAIKGERVKLSFRKKGKGKTKKSKSREGKGRRKSRKSSTILTNIRRRGSSGGVEEIYGKAIKTLRNAPDAAAGQARRVAVLTKGVSQKTLHNVVEESNKLFGGVGGALKDAHGQVKGVGNKIVTGEIFKKKLLLRLRGGRRSGLRQWRDSRSSRA